MELYKELLLDMCYRGLSQIKCILLEEGMSDRERLREVEAVMVWFMHMDTNHYGWRRLG